MDRSDNRLMEWNGPSQGIGMICSLLIVWGFVASGASWAYEWVGLGILSISLSWGVAFNYHLRATTDARFHSVQSNITFRMLIQNKERSIVVAKKQLKIHVAPPSTITKNTVPSSNDSSLSIVTGGGEGGGGGGGGTGTDTDTGTDTGTDTCPVGVVGTSLGSNQGSQGEEVELDNLVVNVEDSHPVDVSTIDELENELRLLEECTRNKWRSRDFSTVRGDLDRDTIEHYH